MFENTETEARANALRQLLGNTQADVIRAFEGRMTQSEYEALKTTRQVWKNELAELEGKPQDQAGVDVLLTTVSSQNVSSIMFVLEAQSEGSRLDEVTITEHADVFPEWGQHGVYKIKDICRYKGDLYRCAQAHTAQVDWSPDKTPALWTKIGDPREEWPDWSQPIGAHDAYSAGDKVTHNGKRWLSTADGNAWEPGVYGWKEEK